MVQYGRVGSYTAGRRCSAGPESLSPHQVSHAAVPGHETSINIIDDTQVEGRERTPQAWRCIRATEIYARFDVDSPVKLKLTAFEEEGTEAV
jgi:hypothetical protein